MTTTTAWDQMAAAGWRAARTRSGSKVHVVTENGTTARCGVRCVFRFGRDVMPTCTSCWAGAADLNDLPDHEAGWALRDTTR